MNIIYEYPLVSINIWVSIIYIIIIIHYYPLVSTLYHPVISSDRALCPRCRPGLRTRWMLAALRRPPAGIRGDVLVISRELHGKRMGF